MSEEQTHENSIPAPGDSQPSGEDRSDLVGYSYLFTRTNLLIGGGVLLIGCHLILVEAALREARHRKGKRLDRPTSIS